MSRGMWTFGSPATQKGLPGLPFWPFSTHHPGAAAAGSSLLLQKACVIRARDHAMTARYHQPRHAIARYRTLACNETRKLLITRGR